ncbi:hypothetical protein ACFL1X_04960, partial [Candidatus Hydrogenedentota bacterium]
IDDHDCVVAFMNGHKHKGGYRERKGVHYVTVRAMVETDQNSFAVVEVFPGRLNVIGHGREMSRTLNLGTTARGVRKKAVK